MSVDVMEEEMAFLRSTALAIPVLAVFMGIAAMAAPMSGSRISNASNSEKLFEEPAATGIQLAVISAAAAGGVGLRSVERPPRLTLVKQKAVAALWPSFALAQQANDAPGRIHMRCSEWKRNEDGSWTGSTKQGGLTFEDLTIKNNAETKYLDEHCK
ncbi:hypothetical protein [Methylocystis bryophila]|uniref:hypothetical protein n=1 Tax=Methylocystis bryophila TaxID=655015 RepID=UPI001319CAAF|nr:hypothetical protein [Methylocystis bryophila]